MRIDKFGITQAKQTNQVVSSLEVCAIQIVYFLYQLNNFEISVINNLGLPFVCYIRRNLQVYAVNHKDSSAVDAKLTVFIS